ncbi:MAG TPA: TlpA disulfide reductase family protein [Bacteroidia bacterium]|jgi:thiol-disulfide isomerase/thioredoxin|nr:TlpA disulfide reductase family protein [Bacteroidia bacterium]
MKGLFLVALTFICILACSQSPSVWKIEDLEKRIKTNSDTTYIVNFWATWCGPCVKELPAFDSIQATYLQTKIKVILVSLDFKEDIDKKVIPFIKKKQVQSEVVLLDEVNGNYFIPKISDQWSGALPATWIVNKKKSINRFFEKSITTAFLKSELQTIP